MVSTTAAERGASPVEGVVVSEGVPVLGGVAVSLALPPTTAPAPDPGSQGQPGRG